MIKIKFDLEDVFKSRPQEELLSLFPEQRISFGYSKAKNIGRKSPLVGNYWSFQNEMTKIKGLMFKPSFDKEKKVWSTLSYEQQMKNSALKQQLARVKADFQKWWNSLSGSARKKASNTRWKL